jgi:hypothetical protein
MRLSWFGPCLFALLCLACRGDFDATDEESEGGTDGQNDTGLEPASECAGPTFDYAFEVDATESCYAIKSGYIPWATAEASCAAWGGHLAALTTTEEHAAVAAHWLTVAATLQAYETWIGGRRDADEWSWSTGEPFEFTAWGPNQPNFEGESACLTLNDSTGGQWHDEVCDEGYAYMCERDL